jgi:hypothetical protein
MAITWSATKQTALCVHRIGNCHAGPENPLLIELEPKSKRVHWTCDQFEAFGNSVSNSQLLDVGGDCIR